MLQRCRGDVMLGNNASSSLDDNCAVIRSHPGAVSTRPLDAEIVRLPGSTSPPPYRDARRGRG